MPDSTFRCVRSQLRKESEDRASQTVSNELLEQMVTNEIAAISEDVFDTDVRKRLQHLQQCERTIKLSRTRKFWNQWRKMFKVNMKIKRAMEEFPCAPSMQTITEQLQNLLTVDDDKVVDRRFYVNKMGRLTTETPLEIERRRKETDIYVKAKGLYNDLLYQSAWRPLDIAGLVGDQLIRKCSPAKGDACHFFSLTCIYIVKHPLNGPS